jgi:hypothetical protein
MTSTPSRTKHHTALGRSIAVAVALASLSTGAVAVTATASSALGGSATSFRSGGSDDPAGDDNGGRHGGHGADDPAGDDHGGRGGADDSSSTGSTPGSGSDNSSHHSSDDHSSDDNSTGTRTDDNPGRHGGRHGGRGRDDASTSSSRGDDDRVIRTGSCGGSTTWKLKVKTDDGRLEVEGEIDSNVSGQRWSWTLRHNGSVSDRGVSTTTGRSGSFEVERKIVDLAGTDRIAFRAVRGSQVCRGVVNY